MKLQSPTTPTSRRAASPPSQVDVDEFGSPQGQLGKWGEMLSVAATTAVRKIALSRSGARLRPTKTLQKTSSRISIPRTLVLVSKPANNLEASAFVSLLLMLVVFPLLLLLVPLLLLLLLFLLSVLPR